MFCPKCGLSITGSASRCPRCLCELPKDMQNMSGNPDNMDMSGGNFSQDGYPQQEQQQGFNNPQQDYSGQQQWSQQNNNYQRQNIFNTSQTNSDSNSIFYWVGQVFKKYAVFEGRARRKEYWFFFLFCSVISGILSIISRRSYGWGFADTLEALFSIAILIPSIMVGIRRLHDTGRSGYYTFRLFIPIVGFILYLTYLAEDSKPGPNQYGPNPKNP